MKKTKNLIEISLIAAFFCFIGSICFCSCNHDENETIVIRKEYRIAIVLPEGNQNEYWRRPIDWALENLNKALISQRQIEVKAEWFDENQADTSKLFAKLARREDIYAIIGPLYSANAEIAANQCRQFMKTLIPATVSSEMIMRQHAESKNGHFLWFLTENDISQCEVLLTRAIQKGAKSVSLLTSTNAYGTTFKDWFAFQAKELGLTVHSMEQYTDDEVEEKMANLLNEDTDCLICIPHSHAITVMMNECRKKQSTNRPELLFSDVAYITPKDQSFEGMEGITQSHDPRSGFSIAYEVKFGESPGYGSSHYFDAISLTGLAILHADLTASNDINASLCYIVDGNGQEINSFQGTGIYHAIEELIAGRRPHITGASGKLKFDRTIYTNVIHSIYCHWQVYNGKHLILEYNTSDDSNRTNSSIANWNWRITQVQDLNDAPSISYPAKKDLYALIITTSAEWINYRHQANAYAIYQRLKKNGVDDEHILLISEDDIAYNVSNLTQGFIQSPDNNTNLYQGIKIDHHPSELAFEDLADLISYDNILQPFRPGSNDNLLVYWVGHSDQNKGPLWLKETISPDTISKFLATLAERDCFRKALFIMETCYSGQVGESCKIQNIPRLLCITAANENEVSKASRYNTPGQIWLSNSFTDALLKQFQTEKEMSIYELYGNIYNLTLGSHVSVYNAKNFGNLRTSPINEFLYP